MRARKKKNTVPRLERHADLIVDAIEPREGVPLHVEIGCGKGAFAVGMAGLMPDVDYYALEKVPDVMVMAVEKAAEAELKNCKFLIADAVMLPDICPAGSVDVLYLNFSDPWPKNRDRKRRLTHINFLETYKKLLKPNGILRIKTDNVGLFDFTLEQLELAGVEMFDLTRDLHNSDIANEVMTEYEKRFSELGFPINAVKARIKRN